MTLFIDGEIQSPLQSPPQLQILIPHENTLRSVLGLITVIILKRVREGVVSFKAANLQHVRLEMEKR